MSRILLVDDDVSLLDSMVRLLEIHGHDIVATTSEDDAIDIMQTKEPFDVVISDWDLGSGHLNGGELVETLYEIDNNPRYAISSGLDRNVPEFAVFFSKMDLKELLNWANQT